MFLPKRNVITTEVHKLFFFFNKLCVSWVFIIEDRGGAGVTPALRRRRERAERHRSFLKEQEAAALNSLQNAQVDQREQFGKQMCIYM